MADIDNIQLDEIRFTDFTAEDVRALRDYYYLRPNKTCDNTPLDTFLWRKYYSTQRFVIEGKAVLMRSVENGEPAGCIPLCREADLPYYFRLQERYFNEVMKKPFVMYLADEGGIETLKASGALDQYEITEAEDLKDYLYDGEKMRTLSGRHLSKKRSHLHKFEEAYEGRWEYRTLGMKDKLDILSFLTQWKIGKDEVGEGKGIAADESTYDAMESLNAEIEGVHEILNYPEIVDEIKLGGIYIDGALKAFSIGSCNTYEKMAVIDIEKADPEIDGLYQVINQQFLLHEFPDVVLVNREDDVGLPGLRRSKMSYDPVGFARKFMLKQKNFG